MKSIACFVAAMLVLGACTEVTVETSMLSGDTLTSQSRTPPPLLSTPL